MSDVIEHEPDPFEQWLDAWLTISGMSEQEEQTPEEAYLQLLVDTREKRRSDLIVFVVRLRDEFERESFEGITST